MRPMKKSSFILFCLSWIPGAGEMYMGFMKMGISLMLLAFGLFTLMVSFNLGIISCFVAVTWFYSFFHAHHLSRLETSEFNQVEDTYLFGLESLEKGKESAVKYKKGIAFVLIAFGVVLLWNSVFDLMWSYLPSDIRYVVQAVNYAVPQILFGLLIIFAGCRMIWGKKKILFEKDAQIESFEENGHSNREV